MKLLSSVLKTSIACALLSASVNTFAATECALGDTCSIPNTLDKVYFSFKPDVGSRFTCEVRATKDSDLQVELSGAKDFQAHSQTVKASKDGQVLSVSIPGEYKQDATEGQIVVHQTLLSTNSEGSIKCFPNS